MNRGVSLLELLIGVVIAGTVGVAAARFASSNAQTQKNIALRTQTEQRMRLFLESKKKQIPVARNPYQGAGVYFNLPFANRNCSFLTTATPTMANCGNLDKRFTQLIIDRFRSASMPSSYFTETTQTDCLNMNSSLPAGLQISPQDLNAIRDCTACGPNQLPVIRMTISNRPGIIMRYSGSPEAAQSAGIAGDDTTLASSICISHNAVTDAANPNSFTQLNLRIRTLVPQGATTRLLELSSVVSTPTPPTGGVRVISSGK